ncbi:neurofilament light polypeptide isoform X2 [Oncorhynchus kisutch]|uniref:Neuronal intermediate filament family member 2 n=2 Tax=Oncorhynchus kisutch TaxID=8019 RepID=A0A8C7F2B3_ONCKI|nr:neurofilament light polypeptide isoform X2 [Oncorhynchus kisutch]
MSYDPYISYRRTWDSYRGSSRPSTTKSFMYSPLYSSSSSRALGLAAGKQRPPASSSLPDASARMDLAEASSLNTELLGLRSQEKEQLVGLNDRFATYIDKVRRLEQQNRALLAELEALRRRQRDPSRLQGLYEGEARSLRAAIDQKTGDKMRMEAERDYLKDVYGQLKERYEEEAQCRADAEEALQRAREEVGRAMLSNCDAEASVDSLAEEMGFLKKVFVEEQAELQAQVVAANVCVDMKVSRPDLSAALKEIRAQYERLANKNMQAAEDWYRGKFESVAEMASKNNEAVRSIREETMEYRRLLQSRSSEIEALRNVIESLNKQLEELEEHQGEEVTKYQVRINDLECDINEAKQEMSRYLREYQDLLNVKMALDIEIAAYRKLLEGEEFRLTFSALN